MGVLILKSRYSAPVIGISSSRFAVSTKVTSPVIKLFVKLSYIFNYVIDDLIPAILPLRDISATSLHLNSPGN